MIVQNNEVFQNEIDVVIARMKQAPFRSMELAIVAKDEIRKNMREFKTTERNSFMVGRSNFNDIMLDDIAHRLAGALIEKAKKAGEIKQIKGTRKWQWIA